MLAAHLADATVIKASNTMFYATLALFLAGNDNEAKWLVASLIEQLGFTAIDTGSLADGGRQEQPGSPIYAKDLSASEPRDCSADEREQLPAGCARLP